MTTSEPDGPPKGLMKPRNEKQKPSSRITGGCTRCTHDSTCEGFHVYVIELDDDSKFDFYVGQTYKTVGQRLVDNWGKYGSRGLGSRLIRLYYRRMRMDLVPKHSIVCPTREDAEFLEAELADDLREMGFEVKGPTLMGVEANG